MNKAVKVYGIKNCDTMKKTLRFLEEKEMDYTFFDYKKEKPSKELLTSFLEKVPLEKLVNKRGTTYRKLSDEEKEALSDTEQAIALLAENSSMIKRPVLVFDNGDVVLGFQPEEITKK